MAPTERSPEEALQQSATVTSSTTTSPRKRRRRAPTSGAADDCFACQNRQRKCDRKRPYCTQCLEYGKDCSGYKTALTWNIGVASRGKLRGLSLPIAKSKKVDPDPDAKPTKKRSTSSPSKRTGPNLSQWRLQNSSPTETLSTSNGPGPTAPNVAMMISASGTSPMLPPSNLTWPRTIQSAHHSTARNLKRVRSHSLRPLDVPTYRATRGPGLERMPMSAHALGGYADPSFDITVESSPTASSFAGYEPSCQEFHNSSTSVTLSESPAQGNFFTRSESFGLPRDNMSSSLSSDSTNRSSREYNTGTAGGAESGFLADPVVAHTLDNIMSSHHPSIHDVALSDFSNDFNCPPVDASFRFQNQPQPVDLVPDDVGAHSPSIISRSQPALPTMRSMDTEYLFENFQKSICPIIVAFDGPSNLHRSHIMRLANESETLLRAITALSAIHIRQQRRRDDHTLMNESRKIMSDVKRSSVEEVRYSLRSLTNQLTDSTKVLDDSVLATFLILGLYQIYNIGVEKFKAQLAGVKKMMAFRPTTGLDDSNKKKAVSWLTLTLTWFESMTDNKKFKDDADTDMHGEQENLSGCDPHLFQMISRLGRLNLLAWTTESNKSIVETESFPSAANSPQEYYSMSYSSSSNEKQSTPYTSLSTRYKTRSDSQQFWQEFHYLRSQLEAFHPPPSSSSSSMHISEFFRNTALISLARFSSQTQISTWLQQAVYHINMISIDIWLSWPLWMDARIPGAGARVEAARNRSGLSFPTECVYVLERLYRDEAELRGADSGKGNGVMHVPMRAPMVLSPQPINATWGFDPEGGHGIFRWKKDVHPGDVGISGALIVT